MPTYLFDTGVFLKWESLPPKWHKYRRDVESGRAEIVLFEALLAESAWKLCAEEGGARAAMRLLHSVLIRPRTRFLVKDPDDLVGATLRLFRLRGGFPARLSGLSLVDRLILAHAEASRARIVTFDSTLASAARLLGLDIDWVPSA